MPDDSAPGDAPPAAAMGDAPVKRPRGRKSGSGDGPQRPQAGRRARRRVGRSHSWRSRVVWLLRVLLPVTALGLVAVVAGYTQLTLTDGGFNFDFSAISPDEANTLRMVNPRYAGTSSANKPYLLTADEAIQDTPGADAIHLVNPTADITTDSGHRVTISAPRGIDHQHDQVLDLSGGVRLTHDSGMAFRSPTAHIDLKANTAHGSDPVVGHGPNMTIRSEGFRVLDNGQRVLFTGSARAVIYPNGRPRDGKPGAGGEDGGQQQ